MKKRLLTLLILVAIWTLGSWWYYTCKIKSFCDNSTPVISTASTLETTATVMSTTKEASQQNIALAPITTEEEKETLDSDADGLMDSEEITLTTNPKRADSDGDGIPDNEEVGSEPSAALDTDGDGKINALDKDDDNDTLPSRVEITLNTNPLEQDTDGDSLNDALEVGKNMNAPLDTDDDKLINAIDPDDDNDGLATLDEIAIGTDPLKKDSDGDGLDDAEEVGQDTSKPKDTDDDGIIDALDNNNSPKADVIIAKDTQKPLTNEKAKQPAENKSATDEVTIETIANAPSATNNTIQGSRLYFPFRSADPKLSKSVENYFSNVANWLKESPDNSVILTGHTDNIGATAVNYKLGLKRAEIIKKILIKQGAPTTQLTAQSKGESQPIASNKTQKGRKRNRRVQLTPIGNGVSTQ